MSKWFALFLAFAAAQAASAHSPLRESKPAHQDVVSPAPEILELTFANAIRLTRVEFGSADGQMSDLDVGEVDGFVTDYSIDLGDLGVGIYSVEWRGLGIDGHAMQGEFEFTVE